MRVLKHLADALTWLRAAIAVAILVLGVNQGAAAMELVMRLLLAAWVTDVLDGPLARKSGQQNTSWIGRNDALVDIFLASCVWIALTFAGSVNLWICVAYLLFWGSVFLRTKGYRQSHAALFSSVVYVVAVIQTISRYPALGLCLLVWPLISCGIGWPRFSQTRLPAFRAELREILGRQPEART